MSAGKKYRKPSRTVALPVRNPGSQRTINRTTRMSDTRATVGKFGYGLWFKRSTLLRAVSGVKP